MWWTWLLLGCEDTKVSDSGEAVSEWVEITADAGPDQYIELGLSLDLSVDTDVSLTAEWNMGDGTTLTGNSISHQYTDAGRYRVVLTLQSDSGQQDSDTVNIVVHHPLAGASPQASHRMVQQGDYLWTLYPEGDSLVRLDLDSNETHTIALCDNPSSIAYAEQTLRVTCTDSAEIVSITLSENFEVLDTTSLALDTGLRPTAILPPQSANEPWWFVDAAMDQLGAIQPDNSILWFAVGGDLQGLSRHPDGTLLLPHFRASESGGRLSTYHPETDHWGEIWLPLDEDGDSDNTTGGTPNLIENVYPSGDGLMLWTPVTHANILRGGFVSGSPLTHETSLRGVLRIVDWTGQAETTELRKQFDEKGRANVVASSPYGDILYVLHPGVASISIIDRFSRQILGSLSNVGIHPNDLLQTGDRLFVYSWLTREIITFNIQDPVRPEYLWTRSFVTDEVLSPTVLLGKQIFHDASDTRMTKTGYIACAHCHPAGDHDGLTWDHTDRGEGLRNTSSLLGRAGVGMGRLHWSGNFDEVQDFEQDIRDVFGGDGFLSEDDWLSHPTTLDAPRAGLSADLDALSAYVTTLATTPTSPLSEPTENVLAGEIFFHQVGCGDCHPAPSYTDSTIGSPLRHDIGTLWAGSGQRLGAPLDGLDTPTLLNIRDTFPYLHDGSAATLQEAIRAHTDYATLSSEQTTALVDFLNSL